MAIQSASGMTHSLGLQTLVSTTPASSFQLPAKLNFFLDVQAMPIALPPLSATPLKMTSGYLQQVHLGADVVDIQDVIYGTHSITEPPLVALLRSPAVLRLAGVCQHGMTGMFGYTPKVTRMEHSIGAMLLVRIVGGSIEAQAAALLHDISHTALSHVADNAFPSNGSYHEIHKSRYVATTTLPELLEAHGLPQRVLDEEQYPLVEQDPPRLCADRLDYGIRDALAFERLSVAESHAVVSSLAAYPSPSDPKRLLVLREPEAALALARAYTACDRYVWSSPDQVDMYCKAGSLIREAVNSGRIPEDKLWEEDDAFWERLRAATDDAGRITMAELEKGPAKAVDARLASKAKVRTIDPDIWLADGSVTPLSGVRSEWREERQAYIQSRRALLEQPQVAPAAA